MLIFLSCRVICYKLRPKTYIQNKNQIVQAFFYVFRSVQMALKILTLYQQNQNNNWFDSSSIPFFFSLSCFLAEIIEYKTIIIESAVEIPRKKPQPSGLITKHFNIITTGDNAQNLGNNSIVGRDVVCGGGGGGVGVGGGTMTIANVQIEPTTTVIRPKEVVSYQRFGRIDKKTVTYPFKCHLCGFSCQFKDSLLTHFKQVHPHWSHAHRSNLPIKRLIALRTQTGPFSHTHFSYNRIVPEQFIQ